MNFSEKIKAQEEEAKKEGISSSGGGDWYRFTEGANKFRVLVEPEMLFEKFKVGVCYTDCGYQGTAKFLTYVLDRKDGKVKLAKLPYTVGDTIGSYQTNEDYAFEGFPMPYDITVNAKNAGTKEVEYTMIPSPNKTEVVEEVLEQISKKMSVKDVIARMKENKKAEHIKDGTWEKNQTEMKKIKEEAQQVEVLPTIEYPTRESEGMAEEEVF